MKQPVFILVSVICLLFSGCSTSSAIRKGLQTVYETAVDERSVNTLIKDKKLTALIMKEILADDMTKLLDVTVKCYFQFPFVVGHCRTLEEAGRVVEIARRLSGNPVVPYLVKKGEKEEDCNMALNLKITAEINARLVGDKKIFASNIYIKTVNCTPVIMGVAGSKETIKAILRHAKSTGGVKEIRSFLVETGSNRSWDSVIKSITAMSERESSKSLNNN